MSDEKPAAERSRRDSPFLPRQPRRGVFAKKPTPRPTPKTKPRGPLMRVHGRIRARSHKHDKILFKPTTPRQKGVYHGLIWIPVSILEGATPASFTTTCSLTFPESFWIEEYHRKQRRRKSMLK